MIGPQLAVLAGQPFDARKPALLDNPALAETHGELLLHPPARDAARLRRRLRPVLAVVLLEYAARPEHAARERHDEIARLARNVAIEQGEPPDLGMAGIARDSQRQLSGYRGHPRRRKDVRMSRNFCADGTQDLASLRS